jgi:hypothetical protein
MHRKYTVIALLLLVCASAAVLVGTRLLRFQQRTPPIKAERADTSTVSPIAPATRPDGSTAPAASSTAELDQSQWATCHNAKAGWEIRYPQGWFVYGDGSNAADSPTLVRTTPCSGQSVAISAQSLAQDIQVPLDERGPVLSIVQDNRLGLDTDIDHWVTERQRFGISSKRIEIASEPAILIEQWGYPSIEVFHDGRLYYIGAHLMPSPLMDAMLATLRFL